MTDDITMLVSVISEEIGRLSALQEGNITPHQRRKNRICTIHSSLAIENNTLSIDQVTAIIDGKRILVNPNEIIRDTLKNTGQASDQATDQVDDSVKRLLSVMGNEALSATEIMKRLGLSHRPTFRKNYLDPALNAHLIERTIPDKPNSSNQEFLPRNWIMQDIILN